MSQISVTINGRTYDITCDDGQEDHLRHLAEFVDKRVAELVATLGQIGDTRLLVLTSLMVADELNTATATLARQDAIESDALQQQENSIADVIDSISERVEKIAAGIESR